MAVMSSAVSDQGIGLYYMIICSYTMQVCKNLKFNILKVSRDQSFTAKEQGIRFWHKRTLKFNPYFWITISVG